MITVGPLAKRLLDEPVARHPPHGGQHALVRDPPADELLVHHALALAREEIDGAHARVRTVGFANWAFSQVDQSCIWARAR